MDLEKDFSATISMVVLLLMLVIFSVLGNGFVLGVIARFKKLRTYPNILLANLALVDLLNALINISIYMLSHVLEVGWFKGKVLAILSSFFNRLFVVLNLASMLLLLGNLCLALLLDLRYYTWKTKEKAIVICFLEWLICLASVSLCSIPLFDIDLQDAPVRRYREVIFRKYKSFLAATVGIFVVSALTFGVLACYSVRQKQLQRKCLNLPQLQAEARLRMDIKTTNTVAMVVIAYIVCYLPVIASAARGRQYSDSVLDWLAFLPNFSIFISSAINPVIYCFRTRRFRSALKQFLKDPFGGSSFQEGEFVKKGQQPAPRVRIESIQAIVSTNMQAIAGTSMQTIPTASTSMQATVGTNMQATVGTSMQATVGTSMQATVDISMQATVGTSMQATVDTNMQTTVGTNMQATVGTNMQATVGTSMQAIPTAGTSMQATAGTSMKAIPTAGTSMQATGRTSTQAAVGSSMQATTGTSMQATASTSMQATAGTSMQATVSTIFHETASTSSTHYPQVEWGIWAACGLRRNAVVPASFQELHVKSGRVVKTVWVQNHSADSQM